MEVLIWFNSEITDFESGALPSLIVWGNVQNWQAQNIWIIVIVKNEIVHQS